MFERLIDLAVEFIQLAQIFFYIDYYEAAVVLRCGKYNRTVWAGPHWIAPLALEDAITVNVKPEPMFLDTQSVHTLDDYLINIQIGITFEVTVPKTFLLDYEDTEDILALLVSGCVTEAIQRSTWKEMQDGTWAKGLKAKANKKARKRGALIGEIVVTDLANGDADRLWIEGVVL